MHASPPNAFAANLKKLRYHFGLTQKELAARFDVSQEANSKWERGLNLPAPMQLQRIAGHFGFSVPDLLNQNSED